MKQPSKQVAVCACDEERDTCDTCGKGYLQEIQNGRQPRFKTVLLKTKMVAVCACNEQRETCGTCNEGYLQMTLAGKPPHFKQVVVDDPKGGPWVNIG